MQLAITLTLRLAGQAQGACSAASDWKLTVDPDNATLRIRYEVDSDVDGEMWLFGINSGNGVPIATGRFAGPDRVGAGARNTQTGETCRGALLG